MTSELLIGQGKTECLPDGSRSGTSAYELSGCTVTLGWHLEQSAAPRVVGAQ